LFILGVKLCHHVKKNDFVGEQINRGNFVDARERKQVKTEYDCILETCDSGDTNIIKCTLKILQVLYHEMFPCKL